VELGSKVMIGKTLTAVYLASDRRAIKFDTDLGEVIAKCDGDCCSSTWIESLMLPAGGLPALVTDTRDLRLGSHTKDYDLTQFYGLRLVTDKGDLELDYRNESNGYYGGNLSWPGEYFYGGVFGQNESSMEWQLAE